MKITPAKNVRVAVTLFACAAIAVAVGAPAARPQGRSAATAPAAFDIASVKLLPPAPRAPRPAIHFDPGRISVTTELRYLIIQAYRITPEQLSGGPDDVLSSWYAVTATTSAPATRDQELEMLRTLLADRFQLKLREIDREENVYALVVGPGGPKFEALKEGESPHPPPGQQLPSGGSPYYLASSTIGELIEHLNNTNSGGPYGLGRRVIDHTDLSGNFNLYMQPDFTCEPIERGYKIMSINLRGALEKQLGLELEDARAEIPYYFVERIVRPGPD